MCLEDVFLVADALGGHGSIVVFAHTHKLPTLISLPQQLSVREFARAQGFGDHYTFRGSVDDQLLQIGNAIPVPLAAALGRQLKAATIQTRLAGHA